jgi:hypothetical protein
VRRGSDAGLTGSIGTAAPRIASAHALVIKRNERGEGEYRQNLILRSKEKVVSNDSSVWEDIGRRIREAGAGVMSTNRLEDVTSLSSPRPR